MTKEEATEKLNRCREILEITSHMDDQNRKAFDVAIKALEQEPCGKDINVPATDAISRQAAIDSLGECPMNWMDSDAEITAERDWKDAVEMLKRLPSVIPQPKTGHWIDTGSGQECSECHEIQYGYDNFRRFCAYCGAKMEVEE